MQLQFEYLVDLSKKYHSLSSNSDLLFKSLNELPIEIVQEIYHEYSDPERDIQPVNLLRSEIARHLSKGNQIDLNRVDELKQMFREKNKDYFAHLTKEQLKELEEYPQGKRDMFKNWQNLWGIF